MKALQLVFSLITVDILPVPEVKSRTKSKLDADPFCINLNFDEFNINAVAAAFKDFLRKLPMPLLPYDVSFTKNKLL